MASNTAVFAFQLNDLVVVAVDSRLTTGDFMEVTDNDYNKLIRLYDRVVIGCSGPISVLKKLRDRMPDACGLILGPTGDSMEAIAGLVQDNLNQILEEERRGSTDSDVDFDSGDEDEDDDDEDDIDVSLVLVGAVSIGVDFSIYTIEKGNNWMHYAQKVAPLSIVLKGSGEWAMNEFCGENLFDPPPNPPQLVEFHAVDFAFRAVRHASQHDWPCGGEIQVVAINPTSYNRHMWGQNNPSNCLDEYIYEFGEYDDLYNGSDGSDG